MLSFFLPKFDPMIGMIKFVAALYFCFLCNAIAAQTDTSFWFVAPEVTNNNNSIHGDRPIYLRITALNVDAIVTVTEPANAAFLPIIINVPANTSQSYDLTPNIDMIENKPSNQILNYGLLIRSTAFVTAYYEEASVNNPEIFALKGRNALGNSFFIPAQNLMSNNTSLNPRPLSAFDIVASEDATIVTITPAKDIVGHSAGIPFIVLLNKGQTYSAEAVSAIAAAHLMGSTVTSNKPIAITIKDDSIGGGGYAGCLDLAGDQIVPLSLIGTKYITLPGYLNNPGSQPTDQVFIMATQSNTTVTINGVVAATLNMGQTFRQPSNNEVFYIEASKPVYVLHLSGFGCEVGHALLPQLDCSGSRTVGFTRSISSPLYVNILVKSGGEGNFSFNGDNTIIVAPQFADVPFSGGQWKYARIQLSTTQMAAGAAAIVKNSSHDFHLSIIHGDAATGCRYGYFSGFNRFDAVSFSNATSNNPGCSSDTLKLYCDVGATEGILFSWTGPNGFTSNLQNPFILNAQTIYAGTYTVVATKPNCNTITATTVVSINQSPSATASSNSPVCEGAMVNLNSTSAGTGASYLWTGPNGYNSNFQNTTINNTTANTSGNYILAVTKNGCTIKDTEMVVVKPLPSAQITSNSPACRLQQLQMNNSNTLPNSLYSWTGPNGFSNAQQSLAINNFTYADTGTYSLTITANGCTSSSSANIALKEIPIIQFPALNNVCADVQPFQIVATETSGIIGTEVWNIDGTIATATFNAASAGVGLHTIRYTFNAANGCSSFEEQQIKVYPIPIVKVDSIKTIVQNASIVLNAVVVGQVANLLWTPALGLDNDTILNPLANPIKTTTYTLEVTTVDGCYATDSVRVKVLPAITIPNAFSPNGDGFNDTWLIDALVAFPLCEIEVFDRNGHTVFKNKSYTKFWDGIYHGKPLPVGTYYYIIKLNDNYRAAPFSGYITLIR